MIGLKNTCSGGRVCHTYNIIRVLCNYLVTIYNTRFYRAQLVFVQGIPTPIIYYTCRTPRPFRRHNARASGRPSASGVSCLRGPYVQRTHNERLTRRVMFGTMACGENPGPGRPENNWVQCLGDDLRVFRATAGSTESVPLVFGVETVLWPTAAKKGGKWYRGVVEAAEIFVTRWHRDEAESSWLRHATEDAKSDDKGRRERKGRSSRTDTAVDECRNETVGRMARYRFD